MVYARARARTLLYIRAHASSYTILHHTTPFYTTLHHSTPYKNARVDYQPLTKKVQKILKKVARKFGQFIKKQYLCSRFRAKRKWVLIRGEKYWKNVMLKISHLQRKCKKYWKKLLKNLVSPKKSSTFAADFATNASERWKTAEISSDLWKFD